MREIKFRAWNKERKDFYFPDGGKVLNSFILGDEDHNKMGNGIEVENERYIFMQYTGLKDKNGVEIYEGDILSYDTQIHKNLLITVEWKNGQYTLLYHRGGYDTFNSISDPKEWLEVVGNIYENPELLKG